jgi:hypothetical protein
MKRVEGKKGTIETPWLDVREAQVYCGFGPTEFYTRATKSNLPVRGTGKAKRYNSEDLDRWINSSYAPYPFTEPAMPDSSEPGRIVRRRTPRPNVLVNPRNGRVYTGKNKGGSAE